jgi:hypothetical protein
MLKHTWLGEGDIVNLLLQSAISGRWRRTNISSPNDGFGRNSGQSSIPVAAPVSAAKLIALRKLEG